MNRYIYLLIGILSLVSCKESVHSPSKNSNNQTNTGLSRNSENFVTIDPSSLNLKLTDATVSNEISSAESIMKMYYAKADKSIEGKEKITIKSVKQDEKITVVTLIHDNLLDDSMRSTKIIMMVIHLQNKWRVISIRQNWRCYQERGDTDWTITPCG